MCPPKSLIGGHAFALPAIQTNVQPFEIGKDWILRHFVPQNDEKYFRTNVLLKGNKNKNIGKILTLPISLIGCGSWI